MGFLHNINELRVHAPDIYSSILEGVRVFILNTDNSDGDVYGDGYGDVYGDGYE